MAARNVLLSLILLFGFLVLPKAVFASNLYISPASGSVGMGQTVAVQIRLNTAGSPVNGVTAVISYPTDKLDLAYVTPGSAFSIEAEKAIGGGTIKLSRGNISAVSGDVNIATIGFRGKSLGQASIQFLPGSVAANASNSTDSLNFGASKGSVLNVTAAAATAVQAAVPKISELRVSEIATNSATVSWKTDKSADSTVEFGVDPDQFVLSVTSSSRVTDHSVKLENITFPPGTKLYLRAKSKDAQGREGVSEVTNFQTLGYKILVKINDQNGKPIQNVKLTLYSDPLESATNDQGQVTYENIAPGNHVLLAQNGTYEKSYDLVVVDNGNLGEVQEFTFQFDLATSTSPRQQPINLSSKNTWAMIILGLSILALVGLVIYIIRKRQSDGGSGPTQSDSNPFPYFENNQAPAASPKPVVFHP